MSSSATTTNLKNHYRSTSRTPKLGSTSLPRIQKRKKVAKACLFCKRSHMTCDDARPCQRCIKREIGHLCCDEAPSSSSRSIRSPIIPPPVSLSNIITSSPLPPSHTHHTHLNTPQPPTSTSTNVDPSFATLSLLHPSPSPLSSNFHPTLSPLFSSRLLISPTPPPTLHKSSLDQSLTLLPPQPGTRLLDHPSHGGRSDELDLDELLNAYPDLFGDALPGAPPAPGPVLPQHSLGTTQVHLQGPAGREERLESIIRAAGVERFDYDASEREMRKWVEDTMSTPIKDKMILLLNQSSGLFATIPQTPADELESEYQFRRHLIDHRAVLDALPVPGCIWRRTGEICRTNAPLCELLGISRGSARTRMANVREIWDEDSNVNYWEKFNRIALDEGQKAVLTSCVLLRQDQNIDHNTTNSNNMNDDDLKHEKSETSPSQSTADHHQLRDPRRLDCTFSFTVKRDEFGLPCLIIGNFLPS